MSGFANTPEPPYYAVIFTSTLGDDDNGYDAMGQAMVDLAEHQPGFLGIETTRGADGLGMTVSYWKDEASIQAWKAQSQHMLAQKNGIERWYSHYELRVAKIERAYSGPDGRSVD
ncbi:MAG: antibiotic biosynthesis monooxygenase [Pseudomonadota bacterium]